MNQLVYSEEIKSYDLHTIVTNPSKIDVKQKEQDTAKVCVMY